MPNRRRPDLAAIASALAPLLEAGLAGSEEWRRLVAEAVLRLGLEVDLPASPFRPGPSPDVAPASPRSPGSRRGSRSSCPPRPAALESGA